MNVVSIIMMFMIKSYTNFTLVAFINATLDLFSSLSVVCHNFQMQIVYRIMVTGLTHTAQGGCGSSGLFVVFLALLVCQVY